MLLKIHICKFEVQSSDEDLRLWILVDNLFWLVIGSLNRSLPIVLLLFLDDDPWVWLIDMHKRILRLLELIHARHTWHSILHTLHTWISLRAMVNPMAFFMALSASVSLWRNCLLVWWTLLVHTWLEPLTSLVELIKILSLAKVLMLLLTAHLITWSSHLWLNIIICRFTIDPFVINIMASISVRID